MVIGIDFDNTIVSYDELFHRLAVERDLVPPGLASDELVVRDYLRQSGREEAWTELQGHVYGARMIEAKAFPGVIQFFTRARQADLELYIISHKTRHPVTGPAHDLHQAARDWLAAHEFFEEPGIRLSPRQVVFAATRAEKVKLIGDLECTHFIDDLQEIFREEKFPTCVEKILFAPRPPAAVPPGAKVMRNWAEIENHVFTTAR